MPSELIHLQIRLTAPGHIGAFAVGIFAVLQLDFLNANQRQVVYGIFSSLGELGMCFFVFFTYVGGCLWKLLIRYQVQATV